MNLLLRIKSNRFLKSILLLFTGTGIAQLVPFLATVLLARLYTNDDYGDLSVFMSISGILGVAAAFRYDLTVILPKKINDARNLLALCILCSLFCGLLLWVIMLIFTPYFITQIEVSNSSLFYVIPAMITCIGMYNAFDNWFNRIHAYKKMVVNKIFLSIGSTGIKLLLGVLGVSLGLVYGTVIGNVFVLLLCIYFYVKRDGFYSYKSISFKKMKELSHEYKDFFRYSLPGSLLNATSNVGLPLLIIYFYSIEYAGLYFFANNIIRQPLSMLTTAIAQAYKNEANLLYLRKSHTLLNFTVKIQKMIVVFIFPILLIFSLFGGVIFSFLFGPQWTEAGDMIKYFAIFILFNANYSPISSIGDILNKQKFLLYFNFSIIASQIVLLFLFSSSIEFKYMILLISLIGVLHFLGIDIYMKHNIKKATL